MKTRLSSFYVILYLTGILLSAAIPATGQQKDIQQELLVSLKRERASHEQRLRTYVNLSDLEKNREQKVIYQKQALQEAIAIHDQSAIFDLLDQITSYHHQDADSLEHYRRIADTALDGPHKDIYLAWLKSYPIVLRMIDAADASEIKKELERYKQLPSAQQTLAGQLEWEVILSSSIECMSYITEVNATIKEGTSHLLSIEEKVKDLPFNVKYRFLWYVHTRIEYIYRIWHQEEKAVEHLNKLEQVYNDQFNMDYYKDRTYLDTEYYYMGIYCEMFYFSSYIGKEKADNNFRRILAYYKDKTDEPSLRRFRETALNYYEYTGNYEKANAMADSLLAHTQDDAARLELYSHKIEIYTNWKQNYEDAFLCHLIYDSLSTKLRYNESQEQLTEMQARFKVDKLALENIQIRSRYQQLALVLTGLILAVVLVWGIYQYRLSRRLRRIQQALILSNDRVKIESEKAKESERMKTAFIQSMCHEIRTPLNAINGFVELALDPTVHKEEKETFPDIIRKNTDQLTSLLNNILEVSNLNSSTGMLPTETVELRTLCKELLDTFSHRNNNPQISYHFECELPQCPLSTNPFYLSRMVNHLLENAYKFTEQGSITLSLSHSGQEVQIVISDTGIGIPEEKAQFIFERFTKLNDFKPGTGLGLYTCHLILQRLNGKIELDTRYKDGARFRISLPTK